MVDKLLHEKKHLDEVLATAFHGQESFSTSLRDAFQASINMRQNKPAELVAKFIDSKLRAGGSKGLTDTELEAALDQALVLFRFIQVSWDKPGKGCWAWGEVEMAYGRG
jgi:cullin-4